MELLNKKVKHKLFGDGRITRISKSRVEVQFQDDIGAKIFKYPDSFESYLKLTNASLQKRILAENDKKHELIRIEDERIVKEFETARHEERIINAKPATRKKSKA